MLISLIAASAAALAPWAPASAFLLTCTGAQTVSQDPSSAPVSIAWQDSYTVDLDQQTYCNAACLNPLPIVSVSASGLQLDATQGPYSHSQIAYDLASNTFSSDVVLASSPTSQIHTVDTGTCTMAALTPSQPPAPPASPPPTDTSPAPPSSP